MEYTMESPNERREFLRKAALTIGGGMCAAMLGQFLTACESDTIKSTGATFAIDLNVETTLKQIGGAIKKVCGSNNAGKPVIIIRVSQTDFLVVSSVCPHQSTEIDLPAEVGFTMVCPLHGAEFSSEDGSWQGGQQTTSLKRLAFAFDAAKNILTITF